MSGMAVPRQLPRSSLGGLGQSYAGTFAIALRNELYAGGFESDTDGLEVRCRRRRTPVFHLSAPYRGNTHGRGVCKVLCAPS